MMHRQLIASVSSFLSNAVVIGGYQDPSAAYLARRRWRALMLRLAFWLLVALPTTAAAVFYGLIAGPRYESEARFIVRSVASQQTTGFDAVFRTFGLAKTVDDAYVIQKYLLSRDALDGLAQQGPDPRTVFSRPEIDRLSRYPRFWREASNESLYDFYLDHVDVTEDDVKGIVRIRVVAFRPDDAQAVVVSLLHLAEAMVNRMNERAQSDSLNFARSEVKRAEANVITAQQELAAYRNKELIVDPSKSATSMIETIGGLSGDLARANAQLKETQAMSPRSPSIPSIKARIAALDERIGIERQRLAGGDTSLANKLGEYERRVLARDLADRGLTNALESLDTARQEAHRQHIYVEEVVQPTLPDESTEPKRLRSILTVFVLGFALFGVCWILVVGAGEHAQ